MKFGCWTILEWNTTLRLNYMCLWFMRAIPSLFLEWTSDKFIDHLIKIHFTSCRKVRCLPRSYTSSSTPCSLSWSYYSQAVFLPIVWNCFVKPIGDLSLARSSSQLQFSSGYICAFDIVNHFLRFEWVFTWLPGHHALWAFLLPCSWFFSVSPASSPSPLQPPFIGALQG